jgi:hypothetical protein
MSLLIGIRSESWADFRALDSMREGKRLVEARYAIIRHEVRMCGL